MRLFSLVLFLFWLVWIPTSWGETTLAVLDFENNSLFKSVEYQSLSKGLAEMMITEMNQVEAIQVVERRKLRTILDELKLTQSGLISEESSLRVGKLLGAQHLVFGGYMVTLDEKIRIDVRVVEVETGLTVKAAEVTGKTKRVLSLIKRLSKKMLEDLDVRMTKREERLLRTSEKLDVKAVLLFSKGLGFEDRGEWAKALDCYHESLKIEPGFDQAKVRIEALTKTEEDL